MAVMEKNDVRLLRPTEEIWQDALKILQKRVNAPVFHSWLKPLVLTDITDAGEAIVAHANHAGNSHITKVTPEIEAALTQSAGMLLKLKLVHDPVSVQKSGYHPTIGSIVVMPETSGAEDMLPKLSPRPSGQPAAAVRPILNPKYTFDTFVVGSSNRFSHSAAQAVSKAPGQSYNPLFIYGGVGLGKTHIMHAIGQEILKNAPQTVVEYVTCEKFVNDVISSIRQDRMAEFRKRYRKVGVLLIDDIQFLAGKESTQEEFFFTFNALRDAGSQIVISSDRPPKAIGVEERLRSRFEWGLIADVQAPDLETRVAILQKKCAVDGLNVGQDVLEFIAGAFKNNIRELEGALIRATAYANLTGEPLSIGSIAGILQVDTKPSAAAKSTTFDQLLDAVCAHYRVEPGEVKSSKRSKDLALPRHVVMYLACEITKLSTTRVGELLGNRAHTSVLHGSKHIKELLAEDQQVAESVKQIKRELGL